MGQPAFYRRLAGAIDSIVLFAKSEVPGHNDQGPVVQGIVGLTSSLRGEVFKCFMTLWPKTMIFLLEKWEKLLPLKFLPFFQQKCWQILDIGV